MKKKPNIGIIGLGNLGWNLALRLHQSKFNVTSVYGERNEPNRKFAKQIEAKLVKSPAEVADKNELIFLCVPDDHIIDVAKQLDGKHLRVCHCSGSTPLIEGNFKGSGVLYPFQTFTKYFAVEWSAITTFVQGIDKDTTEQLMHIASKISSDAVEVAFEQRRAIHIAGVIGANFTNHLLAKTSELLDKNGIEFEVLKPLMEETVRKAFEHGPAGAQTGPARRQDHEVIKKHLELLAHDSELHELYKRMSNGIMESYK